MRACSAELNDRPQTLICLRAAVRPGACMWMAEAAA
jgi:hypothetical protein